jgi:hypothetical protein
MFMVYWVEINDGLYTPRCEDFDSKSMSEALKLTETLRKQQAADGSVGFVTLASENPNSVGKAGAAEPPADYNWTKRRDTRLRKDADADNREVPLDDES